MRRALVVLAALGLLLTACDSGTGSEGIGAESPVSSAGAIDATADVVGTTTTAPAPATSVAPDSTTTEPQPPDTTPHLPLSGATPLEQTTLTEGVGPRPLLTWSAVEGATSYTVVVFDETGEPYWAALTSETEIYVGGASQVPDGVDGPIIGDGYQWVVYADDGEGVPIGSSPLRPISP